ncbi:MAG: proprotein convertase P-domain-containing protein [Mangrovimonas sp.]|nr:proprotein convertase P-domain-containing protein [Mangrovimonas sp.]
MRKITIKLMLVSLVYLCSMGVNAQKIWKQVEGNTQSSVLSISKSQKTYETNLQTLTGILSSAPLRNNYLGRSNAIIELPDSKGNLKKYRVEEAPVFAPELQAQYPEIRSYAAYGIDDPTAFARFCVSPYKGVNGIILSGVKDETLVIEADLEDVNKTSFRARRSSNNGKQAFECTTEDDLVLASELYNSSDTFARSGDDGILHTFDLAMSVTGEYSQFHGGTLPLVNSAIAITVTRVNGVYETDFNVTMILVSDNDDVIYLNPNTDPYSGTSDAAYNSTLQTTLDANITSYDIGHLMAGIGNNGNAGCIGCICVAGQKGSGFTTSTSPIGDNFDIDYVAHEMGHQFGANHTFTHASEGSGIAQMEPGSGSTIMGYAGITGATDVQPHSDPYFHAISIQQITAHVATRTCDIETNTGNNAPVVNAGSNLTLPIGTAFTLTGSATDADSGDVLTYCWEQFDENNGNNAYPDPTSANSNRPLFRSYNPTTDTSRTFPKMEDLLSFGINGTTWEKIPTVGRSADFRLTVRDNRPNGGTTSYDDMVVTWDATKGPLTVTSQNTTGIIWNNGDMETVTWDVNNTSAMAGAANVNILLSTDGGQTYSQTLASNIPNNGSATVTVPNTPAPYCRLMIQPTGAPFFAINSEDFSIDYQITTSCETFTVNPNFALPDAASSLSGLALNSTSTETLGGNVYIKVGVDITHTYIGDLYIALQSPTGTFIWLAQEPCGNYEDMNVTFVEGGSTFNCASPTVGDVAPIASFSAFDGESAAGEWILDIADAYSLDTGTVNSWTLEICSTTETQLSVEENEFLGFSLFPNPNNGEFTIKFKTISGQDQIGVQVSDIRGRTVFNNMYVTNGTEFNQTINLGQLQSGMYLVNVSDGQRKITKKIVLE